MHTELFNPIDIFTYYLPKHFVATKKKIAGRCWVETCDLWPEAFLEHTWTGSYWNGTSIKENAKAVGFKSFPDHWMEVKNEVVWQEHILEDFRVKKVILVRDDELAVYVSMKRAEITGNYMTLSYPKHLKLHIDPADFQTFINNYRDTFRRKYKSPMERRDTFRVSYEQMLDLGQFEKQILPLMWEFLGVDPRQPLQKLRETTKQADPDELLSDVIENYDELEFCFRHSDVLHFTEKNKQGKSTPSTSSSTTELDLSEEDCYMSWSLLVPICSRTKASKNEGQSEAEATEKFNSNRLIDLAAKSQYSAEDEIDQELCWKLLHSFAKSLSDTASAEQLLQTECVVGIDVDDPVFANQDARQKIRKMLPCTVLFVEILPENYGRVCKIWNQLARQARCDFVVLLGDDVVLLDYGWQQRIVRKFHSIAQSNGLPFGAACVALRDMTFPGFPTFPVMHRWHIEKFGTLIPKQFVNQGADPYLFELYSRYKAAAFEVTCRLENTIGGDNDARYKKYEINWRGQILRLSILHLRGFVGGTISSGICIDIVVPSYRINNSTRLHRIASLRASTDAYVRFWIVVDNPLSEHISDVQELAKLLNDEQLEKDGNYFVNVVSFGQNRGASHARSIGYNYSTADWVLFLDDDVIPDDTILDAYIGAIPRYPDAKVFVGLTELPECRNCWTEMLRTCNIMFFYGVAGSMTHPPWGVTANLMVRGSRHNPTIQFKNVYPKTGGGEDVDFVLQFKQWYQNSNTLGSNKTVVGVPGAKAQHPWWCNGNMCYGQINGWAWGDSLCITEWPQKTFLVFPNWIECLVFGIVPFTCLSGKFSLGLKMLFAIAGLEHFVRTIRYFRSARSVVGTHASIGRITWVAFGAGMIPSAQEIVRVCALVRRLSLFSLCRRFDWNDGQQPKFKLDVQFGSFLRFAAYAVVSLLLVKGEERPFCSKT